MIREADGVAATVPALRPTSILIDMRSGSRPKRDGIAQKLDVLSCQVSLW
jgi:hypothetical protein